MKTPSSPTANRHRGRVGQGSLVDEFLRREKVQCATVLYLPYGIDLRIYLYSSTGPVDRNVFFLLLE